MVNSRRRRSAAASLVLVLVGPLLLAPLAGSASMSGAGGAWARAAEKRPKSSGTPAQRQQAKDVVRASAQAAGRSYVYGRAVVQVHGDKAVVQAVAPDKKQAISTVFVVDLAANAVQAARTMRFAKQSKSSGTIAISVADGSKTRFRGAIDQKTGKLSAAEGYSKTLSKALSAGVRGATCDASPSARTASVGQPVQTAGVCEWAVAAICGTAGGVACYGACLALGLVGGPGGLGCTVVCGLIVSLGCAGAVGIVCG